MQMRGNLPQELVLSPLQLGYREYRDCLRKPHNGHLQSKAIDICRTKDDSSNHCARFIKSNPKELVSAT